MRFFAWRPIQKPFENWKIVRDDMVEVISGHHKKQKGKVLSVNRKHN